MALTEHFLKNKRHDAQKRSVVSITIEATLLTYLPMMALVYSIVITPLLSFSKRNPAADALTGHLNNVIASQSNFLNQAVWLGLFVLLIISARPYLSRFYELFSSRGAKIILLYLCLCALSVLWSDVPFIALRRLILQMIVISVVVVPFFLVDDIKPMIQSLVSLCAFVVLINLPIVLLYPAGPIGHEGIYPHKNVFGLTLSICLFFIGYGALNAFNARRYILISIFCIGFFELVMSQSKTSLGLVILLPLAAFCLIKIAKISRVSLSLLLFFSFFIVLLFWFLFSSASDFQFEDLSLLLFNDTSFTGRTVIWDFVLGVFQRDPLLGHGYASFWGTGYDSVAFREAPRFVVSLLQAHNGYLDILLETGIIGLIIMLALIMVVLAGVDRLIWHRPHLAYFILTLLLFVIFHNMMESSWFRGSALPWMAFLIAYAMCSNSTLKKPLTPSHTPYHQSFDAFKGKPSA